MKLYHVLSWSDQNPAIIADSAHQAGEKYLAFSGLNFTPPPRHPSAPDPDDTACFGDPETFPPGDWISNPSGWESGIDDLCCFFVEPVCLGEKRCIECQGGVHLVLREDIELVADLLKKRELDR